MGAAELPRLEKVVFKETGNNSLRTVRSNDFLAGGPRKASFT
jgi:hypothetical protein